MSTILPPPPTPLPLPTVTPAPVVTVPSPPVALAELAAGTNVRAEIVALLQRGLAEVETDFGNFQIRSNIALRVGAELDLQLIKSGAQVQLAIRGVDGHAPPGQGAAGNVLSQSGHTGAAGQVAGALGQAVAQDGSSGATSALASQTQAALSVRPGPLVIGAALSATLLPRPPGAEQPIAPTTLQTTLETASGSSAAPAHAPTTAIVQTAQRLDANGIRLELRLLSATTGSGTQTLAGAVMDSETKPTTLSGTVTAFTPSGKPIVETPAGLLTLDTNTDVRIGHKLTFAVLPPNPRLDTTGTLPSFLETFIQKKSWPTLEQAIAHLGQRAGDAVASAASSTSAGGTLTLPIPQAKSHLAQNLIAATSALADGDVRAWLGDLASALEQDQPNLFHRLSDEFAQIARLASEPRADDWRTALIPFFTGANMEPVQMHLRGERQPKDEKKIDNEGSRFIIDLQLSNLGRFQMDGFMKERGENKSFDLIVRTDNPLPQRMRYDINRIFSDFAEVAGLRGAITFQAHAQFVEVPLPSLHRDGGVMV